MFIFLTPFKLSSRLSPERRRQWCAAHPKLNFRIISGNGEDLAGGIANGTIDLALFVGPGRYEEFDYQDLPDTHRWGLLLKADDPLARKKAITPKDLPKTPVIASRQRMVMNFLAGWLGQPFSNLSVAATYNLLYNAAHLVSEGLGAAICLDGLLPAVFSEKLVFRPFSPVLTSDAYLAWKRGTTPSPAAQALIHLLAVTSPDGTSRACRRQRSQSISPPPCAGSLRAVRGASS